MPGKHDQDQIKADAAMAAQGKCPECGNSIEPGSAEFHVAEHWPRYSESPNSDRGINSASDAARRIRLCMSIDDMKKGAK